MDARSVDPCPVGMRGIVPSLNTPFDENARIDEASARRLVEATIEAGCQGMLAMAVAGEQESLSLEEKDRLIRVIVETAAGRVPTILSVTSDDREMSCRLASLARNVRADGILCQAPAGIVGDQLIDYFNAVSDCGPDLLMIQDLDWTGSGLAIPDIVRLFDEIPKFQCLKIETAPAGPKYSAVLEATDGKLHTSGGWAAREMIDALDRGVHAFMPTAMDPQYVAVYKAFIAGDRNAACRHFEDIRPILDFANQHIEISIRFFKMLRSREGVFETDYCRPPVRFLDNEELLTAAKLIDQAMNSSQVCAT